MKAIRHTLAYREGFGPDRHTQLARAYAIAGCYDHTPPEIAMDMMNERELQTLSTDPHVWEVLDEARRILFGRFAAAEQA